MDKKFLGEIAAKLLQDLWSLAVVIILWILGMEAISISTMVIESLRLLFFIMKAIRSYSIERKNMR